MSLQKQSELKRERLAAILAGMEGVRIGVIGDLCLDAYWTADMTLSALSRETPFFPLPITGESYSPGGAGNVAVNAMALTGRSPVLVGTVGRDWRAELLISALKREGISTDGVIECDKSVTNAFIKPLRRGHNARGVESERLDFANAEKISSETEQRIIEQIRKMKGTVSAVCVCDQIEFGCVTDRVRDELEKLGRSGVTVIADSRDRISLYKNAILKPNEVEGVRALDATIPAKEGRTPAELRQVAISLSQKTGCTVLLTMGVNGSMLATGGESVYCPAFPVSQETDICGAGDTFTSAFACALAGGADLISAMQTANLASSVTIRKLGTTGVATRRELMEAYDAEYRL